MKKIICIVLFFSLLFAATACGNSLGEQSTGRKTEVSENETAQSDAESDMEKEQATGIISDNEAQTEPESQRENPEKIKVIQEVKKPAAGLVSNNEVRTEIPPAEYNSEGAEKEEKGMKMKIQVGDTAFTATLAENSSVDAFKELIADGPLTLDMSDYANMEKGADLGVTLPQNNKQMNTQAGDIILYQGRTFVIYYDTNSWSLTPIGKIDNTNADELRAALGTGDVTVTLSLK